MVTAAVARDARANWAGAFIRHLTAPESCGWIVGRRPSQSDEEGPMR